MDILTEDMKKELKEKFKALDINDKHFQEKAQAIIDEAIIGNKDKIGETVVQQTVDEALEEEKGYFDEFEKLMDEGEIENIDDQDLKDELEEQATHKILDEAKEKLSMEKRGLLKEPNKATTVEDVVEEVLKQLEEVIEEKKQEIEEKIQKNEDMLGKVEKRERLRASKVKFGNLHQKTQNCKGDEGIRLHKNLGAAIANLDKQIDALVTETTVDGKELQSDALEAERKQLKEEKKKLEDMSKFLKEKYTKDHSKEASKVIIKDEITQIMGEIQYGMNPNNLVEKAEAIREIYEKNVGKYTGDELLDIFKGMPLHFEQDKDLKLTAASLVDIGKTNAIRRLYIRTTNLDEKDRTDKDKQNIKKCEESFEKDAMAVERICAGRKLSPLKTEDEYIEELEALEADIQGRGLLKGVKTKDVAAKSRTLRRVLKEILTETTPNRIEKAFNKLRTKLKNNKVKEKDLPEAFVERIAIKEPVVAKVPTPKPGKGKMPGEKTTGEKAGETKTTPLGDGEEGDEEYGG